MLTVYGIKTCESIRTTRSWLNEQHIDHRFHDYRAGGVDADLLERFISTLGLDVVLNKRSSSWRLIPAERKQDLSRERAIQFMLENPALIKRPIIENGTQLIAGFNAEFCLKTP